jgi:hypothetical protein
VCVHVVRLLHSVMWVASIMFLIIIIISIMLTNDPCSVIVFFMFVMFCACEIELLLLTKFHVCCVPLSASSIKAVAQCNAERARSLCSFCDVGIMSKNHLVVFIC